MHPIGYILDVLPDWIFEVKWDGIRILAKVNEGKAILHTRELQDYTKNFPPVVNSLLKLKQNFILDGEMVVLDENGHPDFNLLQNY